MGVLESNLKLRRDYIAGGLRTYRDETPQYAVSKHHYHCLVLTAEIQVWEQQI